MVPDWLHLREKILRIQTTLLRLPNPDRGPMRHQVRRGSPPLYIPAAPSGTGIGACHVGLFGEDKVIFDTGSYVHDDMLRWCRLGIPPTANDFPSWVSRA